MAHTGRGPQHRQTIRIPFLGVILFGGLLVAPAGVQAQEETFDRLRDRGTGVPVSMFGTYVEAGEFRFYPYFEYYWDADAEYSPNEFGYDLDQDFRGEFEGREWLVWFGYGISERLAVEFEAAYHMNARQEKSPDDPSNMPSRLKESGLGDVEGQIRWLWSQETETRPGIFTYFETVLPLQDEGTLIGTSDWEFKLGSGLMRAYRWGTTTFRAAVEYDNAEQKVEVGEIAVEYLKRISSHWRVFAALEGSQDEWELITEAQWFLRPNLFLKLNNAFGVTSKAEDWAPEIGIMFSFR